jgi:hypothetical protein
VKRVWLACAVSVALSGCARSGGVRTSRSQAVASQPAATAKESPRQPVNRYADSIHRGVDYLVSTQQPDGSWGTGLETRGYEVYHMVPGTHDALRVATTALCVMALREAGIKEPHDKGLRYLVEHGEARRDHGALLYNVWAHTYALHALALELQLPPAKQALPVAQIRKAAEWHLDRLGRYEVYLGGWNYYDFDSHTEPPSMEATSFGTAAGLVALYEAKQAGLDVPPKLIGRAFRRLEEMRVPNGAYLYSGEMRYKPLHPANYIRGSVGRTQACNDALWLMGSKKVGEAEIRDGLEMFFREHDYIDMGRKRQWPHESWYMTAPYYYYFGHYYTARLIERLGPATQKEYGPKLAATIVPHQESDGSWWDYAMWDYHKPYGTAFSVMTLLRCDPDTHPDTPAAPPSKPSSPADVTLLAPAPKGGS